MGAGHYHSLAVKSDGTLWAWGDNSAGQLGDGTTTSRTTPVPTTGLTGVARAAGGYHHTLAARTGVTSRSQTLTYGYDAFSRLTSANVTGGTATSYGYDAAGNRLTKTVNGTPSSYNYDAANRLTSTGSTAYSFDANGNTTNRGSDTFGFDAANRLAQATIAGTTSTYAYDGDGRRASATMGGTTTRFTYDVAGGLPLLLDDGTRKYVWGADGLAYSVDTANTLTVYHTDGLGSVRALTDAAGAVVQTYETDEFGVPIAAGTQGSKTQPFGFTGEQRDAETGFSYLRARMYDPQVGRFLSKDPFAGFAAEPQSLNRFAYAGNNPGNLIDPSGLAREGGQSGFAAFLPHTGSGTATGQSRCQQFFWKAEDRQECRIREHATDVWNWEESFGSSDREIASKLGLKGQNVADFVFYDRQNNRYIIGDSKRTNSERQIMKAVLQQIPKTSEQVLKRHQGFAPNVEYAVFINNANFEYLTKSYAGLAIRYNEQGRAVLGRYFYVDDQGRIPTIAPIQLMTWHPLDIGGQPVYAYRYIEYTNNGQIVN